MKMLVVGKGWIGKRIADQLGADTWENKVLTRADADMVAAGAKYLKYDVIINAAGVTGRPNVDWCESHRAETFQGNAMLPYLLAQACAEHKVPLVHISSGCIYQGDNGGAGFAEGDTPNFAGSFYSFTKLTAERLLQEFPDVLTLRIRIPICGERTERNIISKLLAYKKIIVVENSITPLDEFVEALRMLVMARKTGTWNVVAPQPITHKRILEIYAEESGDRNALDSKTFIDPAELDVLAPRSNCVLSSAKLESFVKLKLTEESVRECVRQYLKQP